MSTRFPLSSLPSCSIPVTIQAQQDPHACADGHQRGSQLGRRGREHSRNDQDAKDGDACQTAQERAQHYKEYERGAQESR